MWLYFDELDLPCPDFEFEEAGFLDEDLVELDFDALDLLELAFSVLLFLAQASETQSERAANEAKKLRRFKNFLRQRQPVAETKRPCH